MAPEPRSAAHDALLAHSRAGGAGEPVLVQAPGRVNLLGEHTDYNGGLCLPAAIDRAVVCAATPLPAHPHGTGVRLALESHGHEGAEPATVPPLPPSPPWLRLAAAVAAELDALGRPAVGMSAGFGSDLPEGAGLSSSAAFEVACGLALAAVADWSVEPGTLAAACRRAEARGLGVPCGPLDQIASCLGAEGRALLLDCATLRTEPVPLPEGADGHTVALVVVDSGIARTLAGSGYPERVRECEEAARTLGVEVLGRLGSADLDAAAGQLPERLFRRVRHVVTENERVRQAVHLCRTGSVDAAAALGDLVDASHESLARDYEVSLPEIDALVSVCRQVPGILGARIVGAGFGGSVLCIAEATRAQDAAARLEDRGAPSALVVHPGAGAARLH